MTALPRPVPPPPVVGWMDFAVVGLLAAFIYALIALAREWSGPLPAVPELHLEARYLPGYALSSLTRGVMAYGVSFVFTLVYGYAMARVAGAERVMLPLLDILQSIPVLGFLPAFVLGLVHLFPERNLGLEIASVLMIFTGQVWNMTFSFYTSLKSVPPDLVAVTRLARMSWWARFLRLDMSFAATGLLWNSMMSMAGGWFFLMVSEAFVLGRQDFRLPGLGSYMSLAIERGDRRAQCLGVLAMLGMIVLVDQLVWRPLVAWSHKFTDEESSASSGSWFGELIRRSKLWAVGANAGTRLRQWWRGRRTGTAVSRSRVGAGRVSIGWATGRKWAGRGLAAVVAGAVVLGAVKYVRLLSALGLDA